MIRELEFKILCERHRDEIYRYARSLLANQADAEDATQEVLLRLWNHLPRIIPLNMRGWLLRTTRNYCLGEIRHRSNLNAPIPIDNDILEEQPDDVAVNPCLAADSRLRLEQARQVLLKLPENLRSAFVLYEVNGLRYREIADTLGIPINTVKIHIARARERLSKLIARGESTLQNVGNPNKEPLLQQKQERQADTLHEPAETRAEMASSPRPSPPVEEREKYPKTLVV